MKRMPAQSDANDVGIAAPATGAGELGRVSCRVSKWNRTNGWLGC